MEKVYNTVLQAQLAGIAAAQAGATGRDVDAAARKVIEDAGYGAYFGHSFGHSLGVEIHESPNATPANNNAPACWGPSCPPSPGIYLPGRFGVRIEDVVVLQEGGCQDITLRQEGPADSVRGRFFGKTGKKSRLALAIAPIIV